ncbi:hypothetical protein GCM10023211_04410 [Orbus sasakiae]|uniref:Uncharacterized protein n=1 Tax=Orbus sasakiae TaxID=1078475 RepID=A0ABP9N1Y4_9GAMM
MISESQSCFPLKKHKKPFIKKQNESERKHVNVKNKKNAEYIQSIRLRPETKMIRRLKPA